MAHPGHAKRTAIPLLALMILSLTTVPLAAAAITLTPSKTTYNPGDRLVVSGTATPNSAITIKVYNPTNNLVFIGQGSTDATGAYSVYVANWPTTPTLDQPFGVYSITATDAATGEFIDTIVEFAQSVTPPPAEGKIAEAIVQITISTGSTYQLGDTVRVFAAFSYNGTKVDPTVTVALIHPPGITAEPQTLIKAHTGLYYFDYTPDSIGTYAVHIEANAKDTTNFEIATFQVTERLATAAGLTTVSNDISAKIDTSQQAIVDRIASAQSTLNGAISSAQSSLNNAITNAQNDIKTSISNARSSLDDAISSAQSAITSAITSARNSLDSRIGSAQSDIKSSVSSSEDSVKSQVTSSEQAVKSAIDGITSAVTTAVQPLRSDVNNIGGAVDALKSNLESTEAGVSAASTWIIVVGIIAAITLVLELVILIRKLS